MANERHVRERSINLFLLIVIVGFLFTYFEPGLIFSDTTPTGGDTPSHFTAAVHFREFLLGHGQIVGWDYGNLAGFPLFHYYFPLPFILCALLSVVLPITVSFKIVSVLGIFLLPFSVFYFLRKLEFGFPAPILGAGASLLFLFVEAQSMWGGNVPSTLAGEFTYAMGMAIALVYLARVGHRLNTDFHGLFGNAVLLALTGLSHGCALLVAGAMPLFFVFQGGETWERLKYYVKVNVLGFLFLAFWLVPWLMYSEYMSPFNFLWVFRSWKELFPPILMPMYGLAVLGVVLRWRDWRVRYLLFGVLVCFVFFHIGYQLNVVDIRFIPFLQLFVVLLGATVFGPTNYTNNAKVAAAVLVLMMVWVDYNSEMVRGWIRWNYEGFEGKPLWYVLREATSFLKGSFRDPRVVYEHSAAHDQFGSIRTFESLPYLSGRATLEGAYLQSSINSPFIFYLQSEVSEVTSCPLPDYHCATLNFEKALPHLKLFNVSHLILRSELAKGKAKKTAGLRLEKTVGPLEIYRVEGNEGRYVVPVQGKPVLYSEGDWKRETFRWFRNYRGELVSGGHRCEVRESIEHDRIRIWTSCVGHPLMVKMSYHPRWRVSGAERIHLAAPGFMVVFPQSKEVVLSFGWAGANYLGVALSLLGMLTIFLPQRHRGTEKIPGEKWLKPVVGAGVVVFVLAVFFVVKRNDSNILFEEGLEYYFKEDFKTAEDYFRRAAEAGPESSFGINGLFYRGLCFYRQKQYDRAAAVFRSLAEQFPESMHAPEAVYHVGMALKQRGVEGYERYFLRAVQAYPETRWAQLAEEQLSQAQFDLGIRYFDRLDLEKAQEYFRKAAGDVRGTPEYRAKSQYFVAICEFKRGKWGETIREFDELISKYPGSEWVAEAVYHQGICYRRMGQERQARLKFEEVIKRFPQSRWAGLANELHE